MAIRKSSISATPKGATADRPSSPSIGDTYNNGTLGVEEIYTSVGWVAKSAPAAIPVNLVATDQGSGRAFNNGRASVAFSSGEGGGLVTDYIITPSPTTSPSTFSGSSSPITITGLQSSQQYTYTAQARNNFGTSLSSASSIGVTATTVPQAPSVSGSVSSATSINLTITPGATGGSAITSYTITSNPATTTQTTSSTSHLFTGLTNGTAYTFTATATNANGTSTSSSPSASYTPSPQPIVVAAGGNPNSGNSGGSGGSGGGSAANSGGSGGGYGGYNGSNGQNGGGNNQGSGQLSLAYGSGTNAYIPVGGNGRSDQSPSQNYAGLGPNNYGSGLATTFNQQNTSTRVSTYGRGCGGSEGGWSSTGSAGQDGLVAWTNTAGGYGVINDTTASWSPPTNSTYTFYAIGGGGGGGGGYYGPGGSGYYATNSAALLTSNTLTITIGSGGSRGARFGNGGTGGTTSVMVN